MDDRAIDPRAATPKVNFAQGAGFSLSDSNALKGIAILGIALHNFFHRVPHIVAENEFDFDRTRFPLFIEQLTMPWSAVQATFSFFGHYGVGIFVTLSCYGLAMSSSKSRAEGATSFLRTRYQKILPMIVACISIWLLLQMRTHSLSDTDYWRSIIMEVVLLCAGLFNILPGLPMPAVGPWWFVPFILQFYVLWALAGKRFMAMPTLPLLVLSMAIHGVVHWINQITTSSYEINLLETPIGHAPEIALGIILMRIKPANLGIWVVPLFAILIAGNWSPYLWPLAPVSATLVLFILYDKLRLGFPATRFLAWVGSLSLPIFMLNGFIRRPFLAISEASGIIGADLVLGFVSAGSSVALAALLTYFMDRAGATYLQFRKPAR